ncbi:MAG: chemotaxis protein CheD [Leptospira sp.]|jgi:chemotaxis protein CheD|nr:chemotaxis protein CheD [Leptospira sp.]NCS94353.1 chemotaxis protein CheD [Leptospira sp.]
MDHSPLIVKDFFLYPGDYCFGSNNFRIRTLLGSCVALILLHPEKKLGGMSHIMLPERKKYHSSVNDRPGKYADDSFKLFEASAKTFKTDLSEYKAKLFGGANMFTNFKTKEYQALSDDEKNVYSELDDRIQIGKKNIEFIKQMLAFFNIPILSEDLGGIKHRKVYLTVWDGEVWMEKPIEDS